MGRDEVSRRGRPMDGDKEHVIVNGDLKMPPKLDNNNFSGCGLFIFPMRSIAFSLG